MLLLLAIACVSDADPPPNTPVATAPAAPSTPIEPDNDERIRLHDSSLRIAGAARRALARPVAGFRRDCSGFVTGVLQAAGVLDQLAVPDDARVADFWSEAEQEGRIHHHPMPHVGDLAYFDHTWDRNADGRMNDPRTHIAVVIDVEPDGTVVMAHKGSTYRTIRMNLHHPMDRDSPDGVRWNDTLRRRGDSGNPLGFYRTAQLWSGFSSISD